MDEFLATLRTFAEFPLTVKTTPVTNTYYRWWWYFRGRRASATMPGTNLSRFYGSGASWLSHIRYRDVTGCHQRLSLRLIAAIGKVVDG